MPPSRASPAGDRAAFRLLYERDRAETNGDGLAVSCAVRQAAEDAVQEAYVKIWRKRRPVRPGDRLADCVDDDDCPARRDRRARRGAERVSSAADAIDTEMEERLAAPLAGSDPLAAGRLSACLDALEADRRAHGGAGLLLRLEPRGTRRPFRRPVATVKTVLRRSLIALKECLGGRLIATISTDWRASTCWARSRRPSARAAEARLACRRRLPRRRRRVGGASAAARRCRRARRRRRPSLFDRDHARRSRDGRGSDNVVALRRSRAAAGVVADLAPRRPSPPCLLAVVVSDRTRPPATTEYVATLTPDGKAPAFVLTVDIEKQHADRSAASPSRARRQELRALGGRARRRAEVARRRRKGQPTRAPCPIRRPISSSRSASSRRAVRRPASPGRGRLLRARSSTPSDLSFVVTG